MGDGDNGVVDIMGHSFRRVKDGLDESQVIPFMERIISERDLLAERQEHLTSLTRLYERTIAEADELAKQIKKESEEQARSQTEAVFARAEEQARQMVEEKTAEALATAREEAEKIKANAKKESRELLKEKSQELRSSLKAASGSFYEAIIAQTDMLKSQAMTFQEGFERTLDEFVLDSAEENFKPEEKKTDNANPEATDRNDVDNDSKEDSVPARAEKKQDAYSSHAKDNGNEEWVELEILPPKDKDEIEKIKTHLENVPEINAVELITLSDKTLVELCLIKPIDLNETLNKLPQVKKVTEFVQGGERKIQIKLNINSHLDMAKNALNSEVQRIFTNDNKGFNAGNTGK
jgi:hypothetical protein